MSIRELLKAKPKAEILKVLEENSLNSQLLQLIKENDKAYDKFLLVLGEIQKPSEEVVVDLNDMFLKDSNFLEKQ